ncbi:hypothetical protein EYZ11_006997 [Aspergillus tanneri]|uniref:Uncharacterized protein n=1 Tax=Aspergillus tanneri TaxID=1220188 RepID=A0A4S3JGD5_9EURO|nr:uncharacterized protein ATNIH1004_005730 [Aspergillus tanneri]KAA8647047.1 hypothetical protein ATNIH1004_005730 [Aspergillus tanneri]THC93537.1 hypothetical protein EYZ11_006997 [Aspergillus tanneri]
MVEVDTGDHVLVTGYNDPKNASGESPETISEIKIWLYPTVSDSPAGEYRRHLSFHVRGSAEWILDTGQYRWFNKAIRARFGLEHPGQWEVSCGC